METPTRLNEGNPHNGNEKADELNALPDYQSGDDSDSRRSSEDAQAGVKRIEAVSKAWTFTSLTIAYVTYGISPQIG
jgi:SP family sugar:H+ symporter-like MFS transporter